MDQPRIHHQWAPITDLTEADRAAASGELPALAATWLDTRERLPAMQVEEFNTRLHREWSIETGIIERLYTLNEGTTRMLIEQGIDAALIAHDATEQSPEHVAALIRDHHEAVSWLFDTAAERRPLSTSFVKALHQLMTRKQSHAAGVNQFGQPARIELLHGQYKRQPNDPTRTDGSVHQYCPPEHVSAEMDRLIEMHLEHASSGIAPDVSAAWLHHRFVQIHPFQDGNGRVARALASLVFVGARWFPLVVTNDDRVAYLNALEMADEGDLGLLVRQFAQLQKDRLLQALSILGDISRDYKRLDQMLDAIGDQFERRNGRDGVVPAELEGTKETASALWDHALSRFRRVAERLGPLIVSTARTDPVFVDSFGPGDDERRRHWNLYQVINTAKSLGYFANVRDYHRWVRLGFNTGSGRSEILLSLHAVGPDYRGVVGASLCLYRCQQADSDEYEAAGNRVIELQRVCDELFQVNHNEQFDSARRRFENWLEESLVAGLEQWRRGE